MNRMKSQTPVKNLRLGGDQLRCRLHYITNNTENANIVKELISFKVQNILILITEYIVYSSYELSRHFAEA